MPPLIPRDREECSLCLHPRDSHTPDCLFSTHEIDVRWLRKENDHDGEGS